MPDIRLTRDGVQRGCAYASVNVMPWAASFSMLGVR